MTTYTTERQLEVAIHAARTTDADAAAQYGMPRRSVSRIRNRWQNTPEFRIARARLSARLADQYADLEQLAIERAQTALSDPKTPARDVASLGKWISEQRALTTGDVTSRTETTGATDDTPALSWEEAGKLREFTRAVATASDEELEEWAASGQLNVMRGLWSKDAEDRAMENARRARGSDVG